LPLAVGPAISQMRAAMLIAVTLVCPDPAAVAALAPRVGAAVASLTGPVKRAEALGPCAIDLIVEAEQLAPIRLAASEALGDAPVDLCIQPWEGRRKRLLVADMDSTIIGVECLDELADFAGVKAEVSAITERAMRGEIGFEGALRERVGMLKGLPLSALEQCYAERVRLNPGARTMIATMAAHGARCVLVSGGFTFFTSRVAQEAGFHDQRANTLIDDGAGALTGEVGMPILGREAKLTALNEEAAALGVTPREAIAIGDGANDLAMIEAAGLGVAYRAKPLVAAQADAKIDHADLTALLYFQGYRHEQFVS
jgi:phosphoserine phosphatase